MKKLTTIFAMFVLALFAYTGHESKQRNGMPPMTTEEREVYSAYKAISVNGDTANFSITVFMNHKKLRHNSQTHNRIRSRRSHRCFLLWLLRFGPFQRAS